MKNTNVVIYTSKKHKSDYSLQDQEDALQEYASNASFNVRASFKNEDPLSGAMLAKMLQYILEFGIRTVLITSREALAFTKDEGLVILAFLLAHGFNVVESTSRNSLKSRLNSGKEGALRLAVDALTPLVATETAYFKKCLNDLNATMQQNDARANGKSKAVSDDLTMQRAYAYIRQKRIEYKGENNSIDYKRIADELNEQELYIDQALWTRQSCQTSWNRGLC